MDCMLKKYNILQRGSIQNLHFQRQSYAIMSAISTKIEDT